MRMVEGGSVLRLPVLTGRAWAFTDGLRAEDILPARFAAHAPAEARRHLFVDLDATLAARVAPNDVLVAGQQLGGGAGAVVAGSFADDFAEAVLAAGLPPLEVDAPAMFHTGHRMRLNLEAGTIANLSSGDRLPVRNLTEPLLDRLRALLGR